MADKTLSIVKKTEVVKLTGEKFLLWKLHDAAVRHADREKQLLEALINEEINKNSRLIALMREKSDALSRISKGLFDVQAVIKDAEKALGVSFENCQIDDVTGEVHQLTHDGGHVPLVKEEK